MLSCRLWSRTLEGELGAILFKAAEDILDEWSPGSWSSVRKAAKVFVDSSKVTTVRKSFRECEQARAFGDGPVG